MRVPTGISRLDRQEGLTHQQSIHPGPSWRWTGTIMGNCFIQDVNLRCFLNREEDVDFTWFDNAIRPWSTIIRYIQAGCVWPLLIVVSALTYFDPYPYPHDNTRMAMHVQRAIWAIFKNHEILVKNIIQNGMEPRSWIIIPNIWRVDFHPRTHHQPCQG